MLRILNDVEIEHLADAAITVLSETHVPRGERMILWAPADDGGEVPLQVRAVDRQVLVAAAQPRHRVRFDIDAILSTGVAARPAAAASAMRLGTVVREVPIR